MDLYVIISWAVFLIVLVLFLLVPYLIGRRGLSKAHNLYSFSLLKLIRKYGLKIEKNPPTENPLYYTITLSKEGKLVFNIVISMIERRTYVYYLWRQPDLFQVKVFSTDYSPLTLVAIPRSKQRILQKLSDYISQMKLLDTGSALSDFVIATDDISVAASIINSRIIKLLRALKDHLNWLYIEYTQPIIEIRSDIKPENAEKIIDISIRLVLELIESFKKVKKHSKKGKALSMMRKILEEI